MKVLHDNAFKCAIALFAAAGLAACSSSDDVADEPPVNPSYDGKSVKTQFAINIATPGSKNQTRMTADDTQMSGKTFLGMNNIQLIPIKLSGENASVSTETGFEKIISSLENITANVGGMHIEGTNDGAKDYKIYKDVDVPLETNSFLFYGEGPKGTNMADKFKSGTLTATFPTSEKKVGGINFMPERIDVTNSYSAMQSAFAAYLNGIAGANSDGVYWNDMSGNQTSDKSTLKAAYNNFITLKAGSAFAILASVQKLYNIAKPIADKEGSDAKGLAGEICKAILNTDGTGVVKMIATKDESNNTENPYTLAYASTVGNTYSKFPETQGLPQGSMVLKYENKSFSYVTQSQTVGSADNHVKVANIVYPACLEYFVNTPLKASDDDFKDWKSTASEWDAESWTNWGTSVQPSTKTIALQNTINYGVASLKTTIKAKSDNGKLKDNQSKHNAGTQDQDIEVGSGFTVTGILIGGQPDQVGWDFLSPKNDNFIMTVFDRDMPESGGNVSSVIADDYVDGQTSVPFYTLLLDNMVSGESATQQNVNFAIELVNTTKKDFYGVDGLVADGQKFYLVGEMTLPTDKTISFPTDTDYRFPGTGINRVFVQDYTTNLNVTFNSLRNAYVTIPDLRASKLQLGLSVDLTWQTGLTFDVNIE